MENDMRNVGVNDKDTGGRVQWEYRTRVADPELLREKVKQKKNYH